MDAYAPLYVVDASWNVMAHA